MNKKIKWCIFILLLIISVVIFFLCYMRTKAGEATYGVFVWENDVNLMEWEEVVEDLKIAGVNEIYQFVSSNTLNADAFESYVQYMHANDIAVYALMGETHWAERDGRKSITKRLNRVKEYNQEAAAEGRLDGIMLDVEPHTSQRWTEDRERLMREYVENMGEAYEMLQDMELECILCIPWFYDDKGPGWIENIIAECCDGIAIMNYSRRDEYGQIENEVAIARANEKRVINIYELQKAGEHGLTDVNTYAGLGMEEIRKSSDKLQTEFGYKGLTFAYHYYEPLKELLEKD